MKIIWAFVAAAGLSLLVMPLGAEEAEQSAEGDSDRYAELVEVKGKFSEVFVLPGVDFTRFDKVFPWGAQFQYRDVGEARSTRGSYLSTRKQEFGISEADRQKFEEVVGEAFQKEFVKGKQFTVIDSIDDVDANTLILRGALLDIISRVPPETVGRSEVYLSSIGAATFVIELMDASSGSVVALVAERRSIETLNARSGAGVPTNSASIMGDIKRWSGTLARRLRDRLDKAIAGKIDPKPKN